MRPEPNHRLDRYRRPHPTRGGSPDGANWGFFIVHGKRRTVLRVIAGNTDEWEHVSVSCGNRCPTWPEMCRIKELFWGDEEEVVQFHPPKSEYINCHPFTLHLWRQAGGHQRPPKILVGPG